MNVSYVGLWKILIEKGLQKQDLVEQVGLSSATVAKMGKGEPVSNKVLEKVSKYISNWNNYYNLKDREGMEKEYKKIKKLLAE